jgi:hypothetical protein
MSVLSAAANHSIPGKGAELPILGAGRRARLVSFFFTPNDAIYAGDRGLCGVNETAIPRAPAGLGCARPQTASMVKRAIDRCNFFSLFKLARSDLGIVAR